MSAPVRYLGLHIDHPTGHDRLRGNAESKVSISVLVGKSDQIRPAYLDERQLLDLIENAAKYLKVLRND